MKSFPNKILHQNRKISSWIGGDAIQMEHTMIELSQLGLDVSFNDQPLFRPALMLSTFDIIHVWNFSMIWTKYQIWAAKRQNRKIVCSMIYHETEAFIPYSFQQIMIDSLDACIFLTEGEVARARRHLTIPDEKIHIIPNGIDPFWLTTPKQKYERKGYVLTVGRLDGSKGQYETAIACKQLGLDYVCVGESINDEYRALCESTGAIVLAPRTPEELIPLYDNAALLVLASSAEIFPLTVMEAGARGLNSVVTDTCEWKDIPNVTWCEYANIDSIQEAIASAIKLKKTSDFKTKLKKMDWTSVAKEVLKVYNEI